MNAECNREVQSPLLAGAAWSPLGPEYDNLGPGADDRLARIEEQLETIKRMLQAISLRQQGIPEDVAGKLSPMGGLVWQ